MLKKWANQLPGCKTFLENFFGTCHGYWVEANYLNYLVDLSIYAQTNGSIKENRAELVQAFHEITGTNAEKLVDAGKEYYGWKIQ